MAMAGTLIFFFFLQVYHKRQFCSLSYSKAPSWLCSSEISSLGNTRYAHLFIPFLTLAFTIGLNCIFSTKDYFKRESIFLLLGS